MINLNKVALVGRLAKDIEVKKTQTNISVCSFTVAIDRPFEKDKADFISCVAWKQSADFLGNYAQKGDTVSVTGRIQTRTYDAKDGRIFITEVVADNVQLISLNRTEQPVHQPAYIPKTQPKWDMSREEVPTDIDDEDIPF